LIENLIPTPVGRVLIPRKADWNLEVGRSIEEVEAGSREQEAGSFILDE